MASDSVDDALKLLAETVALYADCAGRLMEWVEWRVNGQSAVK